GTYWAAQPEIPKDRVVVRSLSAVPIARRIAEGRPIVWWKSAELPFDDFPGVHVVEGPCDPWHILSGASALVGETDRELLLIASLLGVPSYAFDSSSGGASLMANSGSDLLQELCRTTFVNPFTNEEIDALQAAEFCGFWRQLIDSNRGIVGGLGFAFWKQAHVATLLWDGSAPFRFFRGADGVEAGMPLAAWRSKISPGILSKVERKGCKIIEVEDGFLRSRGLGADCIPPLSITVDRLGAHFDPSQPSELESLIEHGHFEEAIIERARQLRRLIIDTGVGKYGGGTVSLERPAGTRRHILVPGQVEDDRAVEAGGCGLTSNLELLTRVRAEAADAYILYKPHPDVVAGHRRGAISREACLHFADEIVGDLPIGSLIGMVDEVHVNSSLAGFEALLREKRVTTHGVPFYAGWGLTSDLGPVPKRRTAKRTIDELVVATLLLYPRYLDPRSGLPCPPEIIVARLSNPDQARAELLVGVRRLQGKLMRRLRSLVQ
ncbi:MAG TPA: capsule biosynthesis protein, partial [Sphingomicrobium sp.]|nr:capsule biosynthesis protein [Sphingomicrobium sp.]